MFWVLRGKNLESQGNLKRLHCESVSQLHDCRLRVRLRTSRTGVANHERSRTTMKAAKRERRKNRKQDNDTAVCVSNVCDRICRSSFGLYSHQRNYTENNPIIIIVVVIGLYTHARTQGRTHASMQIVYNSGCPTILLFLFFSLLFFLIRHKYHDSAMYM